MLDFNKIQEQSLEFGHIDDYQLNLTSGCIEFISKSLIKPQIIDDTPVSIIKYYFSTSNLDKIKEIYLRRENHRDYSFFESISKDGSNHQYIHLFWPSFGLISKLLNYYPLSVDRELMNSSNEICFRYKGSVMDAIYYGYDKTLYEKKPGLNENDFIEKIISVLSDSEKEHFKCLKRTIGCQESDILGLIYAKKNGNNYMYLKCNRKKNAEKAGYLLGKKVKSWKEGSAKTVTFIVTEDCQLRCKYCYIVGKNSKEKMDLAIAKKAVDYLIGASGEMEEDSLIIEFIGGEPFIEIELIDRITDYFKLRMYETSCRWFNNYRISISTNGLLYSDQRVQEYIRKNMHHISIGITIDGIREKHDIQRVFPDGRGSFEQVVKNVPLWLKQFPGSYTKVTVASDDLLYLRESVIFLWELGLGNVAINTVYEDVWKEGDDILFENELHSLADYIIDHELYKKNNFSFFSDNIGYPETEENNWCGSGRMLAIDTKGDVYPCVRFVPYSMVNRKEGRKIGDIYNGINWNYLRPFDALTRSSQSSKECVDCEVASGCAWCQGFNFDSADTDTIYQRATYICKMHKARVKANKYYWDRLYREKGIVREMRYV